MLLLLGLQIIIEPYVPEPKKIWASSPSLVLAAVFVGMSSMLLFSGTFTTFFGNMSGITPIESVMRGVWLDYFSCWRQQWSFTFTFFPTSFFLGQRRFHLAQFSANEIYA
jgi:hypothetical protein